MAHQWLQINSCLYREFNNFNSTEIQTSVKLKHPDGLLDMCFKAGLYLRHNEDPEWEVKIL